MSLSCFPPAFEICFFAFKMLLDYTHRLLVNLFDFKFNNFISRILKFTSSNVDEKQLKFISLLQISGKIAFKMKDTNKMALLNHNFLQILAHCTSRVCLRRLSTGLIKS